MQKRYGITLSRHAEMLAEQGGICANPACGRPAVHIDHDHACCDRVGSCGQCVRGVLCYQCNIALGMAGDDPKVLIGLVDYLEGWKNQWV